MERISNIDVLEEILSNEDPLWQRRVFNETGVLVLPWEKKKPYWGLLSSCGLADLEADAECHWINGKDVSPFCDIANIEQLISYIQRMDTYRYVLKDVDLGGFKKSGLFWTIYHRILFLNRYSDDDPYMGNCPVYGLRAIEGPGVRWLDDDKEKNSLWFDTSVCGIDQLPETMVNLGMHDGLNDIVADVASQIREYRAIQDWEDTYPPFSFDPDLPFKVPSTYDEVAASFKLICY